MASRINCDRNECPECIALDICPKQVQSKGCKRVIEGEDIEDGR